MATEQDAHRGDDVKKDYTLLFLYDHNFKVLALNEDVNFFPFSVY